MTELDILDPDYLRVRAEEVATAHSETPFTPKEDRVRRHHDRGMLTAEERMALLFDDGEYEPVFAGTHGVLCGYGMVNGRPCYGFAWDPLYQAGACGENGYAVAALYHMAAKARQPIIGLMHSSGADIKIGVDSLAVYSHIFHANSVFSGEIPQIAVMLGYSTGGAAYSPALCHARVAAENAFWAVTGPGVLEKTTGKEVGLADLGGAEMHSRESGQATLVCPDERGAIEAARELISMLPSSAYVTAKFSRNGDPVERRLDSDVLDAFITARQAGKPSDVRPVIAEFLDAHGGNSTFFELSPDYAPNIVVGLGSLNGRTVGIVANALVDRKGKPVIHKGLFAGGALHSNACHKAAKFIGLCDRFHIPLVTLVDVSGVVPDPTVERDNVQGFGAQHIHAYHIATVPKVSILVHQAFGGAWCIESTRITRSTAIAWSSAQVAVMGARQAVEIIYRRVLNSPPTFPINFATRVAGLTKRPDHTPTRDDLDGLITEFGDLARPLGLIIDDDEDLPRVIEILRTMRFTQAGGGIVIHDLETPLAAEYTRTELTIDRASHSGLLDYVIEPTETRQALARIIDAKMVEYTTDGLKPKGPIGLVL